MQSIKQPKSHCKSISTWNQVIIFFISDMKFKMSKIMKSSVKKEKIQIEIGIEHTLIYSSKETKKFTLMFWEPKDKFLSLQF